MVMLTDADIQTREVLTWKGLHLFHAQMSSCSQKVRICLNLKGVEWISHPLDVLNNENLGSFYMGVNPRGLIPALVHDGSVHIESNDIIVHLECCFPAPALIPPGREDQIGEMLKHENDLHMALRTLTFRFMVSPTVPPKSSEDLSAYARNGAGTVGGAPDEHKARETRFWQQFLDGGISDESAREAAQAFRDAFDALDRTLDQSQFVAGDTLSVVDIAWCVYVNRLWLCGYPVERLHPALWAWFERLRRSPNIDREISVPPEVLANFRNHQSTLARAGKSLEQVAGW